MVTRVSSLVRVLVVASALALGGCGGGGGGGSASDAKQNFLTKGDRLCEATTKKVVSLAALASDDPTQAIVQALPAFEALSADMKAVPPPPGDAEAAAIIAQYDKALDQFKAIVTARQSGDVAAEQKTLAEMQGEARDFAARVKAYGFKKCGQLGT